MELEEKKHLFFHEWLVIILFSLTLFVISLLAWMKPSTPLSWKEPLSINSMVKEQGVLAVAIDGAVEFPGGYDLPVKSTVQDLLNIAKPLPEANLSKVKQKSKLKNLQKIQIPYKKWLAITVEGAIENPGPLKVLEGTRYCDLIKLLKILPGADIKPLNQKKGLIREGEVIKIHSKEKVFNHEK